MVHMLVAPGAALHHMLLGATVLGGVAKMA